MDENNTNNMNNSGGYSTDENAAGQAYTQKNPYTGYAYTGAGGGYGTSGPGGYYPYGTQPPSKGKRILLYTGIALGVILLFFLISRTTSPVQNESYSSSDYVARIFVEGTISSGQTDILGNVVGYNHSWTMKSIDRLMDDEKNKGLMIFVNTPGGSVYESDELYLKVVEYKEVTGRPVYAYMGATAASGGYYVSAAADKIIANRNTWTGSIGVTIGTIFDVSEFLEDLGIKTVTITSGDNKSMGSSFEAMTEEQREIMQTLVNNAYYQFVSIVADGRNMDTERVLEIADGRIYDAGQALDLGLVDAISGYEDAVALMKKENQLEDCEFVDIIDTRASVFGSILGQIAEGISNVQYGGDAAAVFNYVKEQEASYPISYLCEPLV